MKLTGGESVHLQDWPTAGHVDSLLLARMQYVRDLINDGLAQRSAAGIKVRQPLQKISVGGVLSVMGEDSEVLTPIILEELNIKELIDLGDEKSSAVLDTTLTPALKREGIMRELIRLVQNSRKVAELNVDDHIKLCISTNSSTLTKVVVEFRTEIMQETLATTLVTDKKYKYQAEMSINEENLNISLEKD